MSDETPSEPIEPPIEQREQAWWEPPLGITLALTYLALWKLVWNPLAFAAETTGKAIRFFRRR